MFCKLLRAIQIYVKIMISDIKFHWYYCSLGSKHFENKDYITYLHNPRAYYHASALMADSSLWRHKDLGTPSPPRTCRCSLNSQMHITPDLFLYPAGQSQARLTLTDPADLGLSMDLSTYLENQENHLENHTFQILFLFLGISLNVH